MCPLVISKLAVQEYLSRNLRDLSKLKRLPAAEVDRQLAERGAAWVTEPRPYQKVALLAGLKLNSLYLQLDPGVGKSKVTLDIFQTRRKAGTAQRMLVLVPSLTNIEAWREECAKHAPSLHYAGLDEGSRAQKLEALYEPDNDIVCVTYQGWLALTHKRVSSKGRKKRSGLALDAKVHDSAASQFQQVVWDEATFLKSHMALSFRSARRFARLVPYRYGLSGTPFDKDPSDLWSQFCVLDGGEALGETVGLFRGAFCVEQENYWAGSTWVFDERKKRDLNKRLRHRSICYRDHECLTLPPVVGGLLSESFMVRTVPWPSENWAYYEQLLEQLEAARKNPDLVENTYLRMRQVCGGFLPVDQEDGTRTVIRFDKNPKLDALAALLAELPPERKVLVYTEYKVSGELVTERLKAEKIKAVRIYSGTADKKQVMRRFKEDPKVRVLVGSRAVCYGLNLQVANYILLYESPDSTIVREQLERRLYRSGQERHVYLWDLAVKNSVDLRILKSLRAGKSLREELLRSSDPKALLTR